MNKSPWPSSFAPLFIALSITLLVLGGCLPTGQTEATTEGGHDTTTAPVQMGFEPYYPADFRDLLIPGELVWSREKSVTLNTDSFRGGFLSFNGRVEVTSLMEFFTNSMKNDGWTSVGTMKSQNVLLAFSKEHSTCMIRITEGGPLGKTDVSIYITTSI